MVRHRRALRFRLVSLVVFAGCSAIWLELTSDAQTESDRAWSPILVLNVVEEATGERSAARFSISVDGKPHEPRWIGPHGLRFVSVHVSKRQTKVVTYARGTGPVWVPLTPGAKRVKVDVVKGLDYSPVSLGSGRQRGSAWDHGRPPALEPPSRGGLERSRRPPSLRPDRAGRGS